MVVEAEKGTDAHKRVKWNRRISGQAWLYDASDAVAAKISHRAATLTGLDLGKYSCA